MKDMKFSVQEVDLTDEDPDFADAELWFLSDGNNAQNSPISTEVLKRDASTFIGKPIVAKYDKWTQDVTSHVPDEVIVGWIPADSTIDFKEKDGKTFAVAHGIISKLYATDVYEMFKNHNYRSVSVEFSASQPDMNVYGEGEIVAIMGHGITILGETVAPCCKDANIQIKKFSLEEANDYYNSRNPLKRFADERKKEMSAKTIKINKDELKTTPWGDVDKEDLRKEVIDAKNKNTLVKSVYLIVDDGWEDAPSQHLKYPVMQIVDGTAYYNRDALASALGYAKKEGEDAVVKKVESLYHKFKLDKEEKDTDKDKKFTLVNDKDKKFTLVNIDRIYGSVWELVRQKYPNGEYDTLYRINGIYEENGNKFAVLNKYDDTTLYKLNFTINSDGNIEIADTIVETEMEFIDSKNVLKFEEPKDSKKFKEFEKKEGAKMQEDDKKDKKEDALAVGEKDKKEKTDAPVDDKKDKEEPKTDDTKKKFSLDAYADAGAMLALLENETEKNKKMATDLFEGDGTVIMGKILDLQHQVDTFEAENKDLKDKVASFEADKAKADEKEVEQEFAKCMGQVKGTIDEKEYAKLYEEGKDIKDKEGMAKFTAKTKNFAFDNMIKQNPVNDDGIFRFGAPFNNKDNSEVKDVFAKYLNQNI